MAGFAGRSRAIGETVSPLAELSRTKNPSVQTRAILAHSQLQDEMNKRVETDPVGDRDPYEVVAEIFDQLAAIDPWSALSWRTARAYCSPRSPPTRLRAAIAPPARSGSGASLGFRNTRHSPPRRIRHAALAVVTNWLKAPAGRATFHTSRWNPTKSLGHKT